MTFSGIRDTILPSYIVGNNSFTVLVDKGYYTGSELGIAQQLGVTTLVAIPAPASSAPDPAYNLEHFIYDPAKDVYICPKQHMLTTNGNIYTKHRGLFNQTGFQQYRTRACKASPAKAISTTAKNGKLTERISYTPVYEQNRQKIAAALSFYKRRQVLVEYSFNTIKRMWSLCWELITCAASYKLTVWKSCLPMPRLVWAYYSTCGR